MASLLPILVSAVTAVLFSYLFNGSDSLFQYTMSDGWMIERVPAYILLGVFGGLISLYFIRTMNFCEGIFSRLRHSYQRLLLGGIVLSMLIFLFPALYGEGYSSINILLNGKTEADWAQVMNNSIFAGDGRWLVLYIFFVLATKVFATSATNGGGGCGGTFAPSLFIGAVGGFFFARVWNMEQIGIYIPEKNFAMLGMAAVMAGVMHAPLTGVFLIAELTGGYAMFIPLMVVSIFAFLTINIFDPHSIYGMRLAREGKLITHHTDHAALTLMSLESIVDTEFTYVQPDMSLQRLVHAISRSKMPVLPVLDTVGRLLGEVHINNIRNIMFRTELYNHFEVYQLMCQPQAKLGVNDSVEEVMHKFEQTKATMLPVEDSNGILVGYITHSRLYSQYRQMVADMSAE
jgi:CIC family chloride channel protein